LQLVLTSVTDAGIENSGLPFSLIQLIDSLQKSDTLKNANECDGVSGRGIDLCKEVVKSKLHPCRSKVLSFMPMGP
jgi:hypothetical protein